MHNEGPQCIHNVAQSVYGELIKIEIKHMNDWQIKTEETRAYSLSLQTKTRKRMQTLKV